MEYTGKYKSMAEQFRKDGCDECTIEKFIKQEMEANEFEKGNGTVDIDAVKLWKNYSEKVKNMWLSNAFCCECGVTSFKKGYNIRMDKFGIMIQGHCSKCGTKIMRVCD